jgi:hypothetical protein
MKSKKNFFALILSLSILVLTASCSKNNVDTSSLYIPTTTNVTAKATLVELQQGRDLYIKYCDRCHALYSPDYYSPAQWKTILNNMSPKTSISASELILVTKYVSKGNQ